MLKQLKRRFVCVLMALVTLTLCAIFGFLYHFTRVNLEKQCVSMMESVAKNPFQQGLPGIWSESVRLPYFVIKVTARGEITAVSGGNYDLTDTVFLDNLIDAAIHSADDLGSMPDYGLRYLRVKTPGALALVFADTTSETATLHSLAKNCLLIGAGCLAVFFGIALLLARWTARPVEKAWAQQRQFVSDASHELKTPLASIRLMTDSILQDASIDRETTREFVADISDAADRLIHISQELLELDRLDQGRDLDRRAIDLNEQAEQIGRMLAPLAESAQVTMTLTLGEGCLVRCNDKDAGQILKNLMENAIKYNVLHGQVDVTTRRVGDKVTLSVTDTGVGIPEADMPRIFERFYRVDKARSRAAGGTGLGLSIVRDAVKRHGGEITVQAGQPAGTIFTVILPAWTGEGETT